MIFHSDPTVWLKEIFLDTGMSSSLAAYLSTATILLFISLCALISNYIFKTIILQVVTRIVKKSENQWDDVFLEQKVFTRLSHFAPALIIYFLSVWALKHFPIWLAIVHNLTYIYMLCIGMIVIISFIESLHLVIF